MNKGMLANCFGAWHCYKVPHSGHNSEMGHAGEHTAGAEPTGFELPDWEFVFAPACYLNRLIAKIAYNFDYTKIKPPSHAFSRY